MILLSQVLGVAGAGVAVSVLWRRNGAINPAVAVGVVAAVVATTLAWSNAGRTADQLGQMHRDAPEASPFEAEVHAGRQMGVNVDFLVWAAERIPPDGTFRIVPRQPPEVYQWSTYQLFPRRHAPEETADYLLFYGIEPARATYDRARFGRSARYGKGFAIARRRDSR
jgi:hypothetical protein